MGKRGPRPKPTNLRALEGGKRTSHRSENPEEPKPKLSPPSVPAHLDAEAKREWSRISEELSRLGLLSVVDRAALAGYCASWSRWVKAERELKKRGLVVKTKKTGYEIQNPYLAIANRALRDLTVFLREFGLSPASRVGLTGSGKGKAASPLDEFLNRQRESRAAAAARARAAAKKVSRKRGGKS